MKTAMDATQIYRDGAAESATPIELVILLYDSAIDDMRRAMAAMQKGDIESRSARIGHALLVLQQLQGTLDFDRGGSAARQFEQFYSLLRAKLLEAQMRSSSDLLQQQISSMSEVRDCWAEAKRLLQTATTVPAMNPVTSQGGSSGEWNA